MIQVAVMSEARIRVPVLIVGGGGCGLACSSMLSNLGIDHVLVESHTTTAVQPKASLLNQRTAEILDQHGIWKEILAVSAPAETMKFAWYMSSLGGDGPTDRVEFGRMPAYGCNNDLGYNQDYAGYRRDSAYTHTNLPLVRLEPVLRKVAERKNPEKILFSHKMVSLEEKDDYVIAEVLNGVTGQKITYEAQYVIAADGGKTVPGMLGIEYDGFKNLADSTSLWLKADLSKHWEEGALMTYFLEPQGTGEVRLGSGTLFGGNWSVLVMTGPSWGKKSEEWHLHLGIGQEQVPLEDLSEDMLKSVVRETLRIPDLEMKILYRSRWHIDGVVARRYQTKRIFLVGDAAHRQVKYGEARFYGENSN